MEGGLSLEDAVFETGVAGKLRRGFSGFEQGSPVNVSPSVCCTDRLSLDVFKAVDSVDRTGVPVMVYGDGNCLFRSVSLLITGDEMDFVTDQYFSTSIKSCERKRRYTGDALRVQVHNRNKKRPTLWNSKKIHVYLRKQNCFARILLQ